MDLELCAQFSKQSRIAIEWLWLFQNLSELWWSCRDFCTYFAWTKNWVQTLCTAVCSTVNSYLAPPWPKFFEPITRELRSDWSNRWWRWSGEGDGELPCVDYSTLNEGVKVKVKVFLIFYIMHLIWVITFTNHVWDVAGSLEIIYPRKGSTKLEGWGWDWTFPNIGKKFAKLGHFSQVLCAETYNRNETHLLW